MKSFSKVIILVTLFTLAFSWTAFFERLERLKDKEESIRKNLDLKSLGLSNLKDISLKDLAHFQVPDMKSKLEKLKHIIPKDLDPSHHKEVDEFWTGVFEDFKLPKPTDLINCFGTVSGQVFFRKMRTINDLLQHSKAHDNLKLHTDYVQFEVLMQALEHAHTCMVQSHDFERLTDALHISHDIGEIKRAKYLYFEAKYASLADDYKGIVEAVDSKDFNKAGKLFGELFRKCVKDYKKQGEDLLAYQAFGNGISGTLGVALPSDSLNCYSSKDAKVLLDFFRGISHAVADGRWYHADKSTLNYWEKEGKALLEKVPSKVWNCDMKSSDSKQISEKVGMDLNSQEFRDKMWTYVNDHNIMFYSYLRTMNSAFEKNDYLHAGATYAHLVEAIVKST